MVNLKNHKQGKETEVSGTRTSPTQKSGPGQVEQHVVQVLDLVQMDPEASREPDYPFLHNSASARNVSVDPSFIRYPAVVTVEIAPNVVYATAQEMADANVGDQRFNISWALESMMASPISSGCISVTLSAKP
ncbi:hypothetical protein NE237_031107 [Protea cynaroides]|uniref:Uncharacterized protein n=1 Tax=Protea cynaroides TaxID=273540 RepID=A0A9Q0L0Z1_9MAGN|nr:hypothetical protein NE237_031107 [Protea cynaroides]